MDEDKIDRLWEDYQVARQRIAELERERDAFKMEMEALLDIYKRWKVIAVKDGLCASVAITIAKMHQDLTQQLADTTASFKAACAEITLLETGDPYRRIDQLENSLSELVNQDAPAETVELRTKVSELEQRVKHWQTWYYNAEESLCSCHLPDNIVCSWHKQNPGAPDAEVFTLADRVGSLEQAKQEAFLEAIYLVCGFCRRGMGVVTSGGSYKHSFTENFSSIQECEAASIHRKLAEGVKG